MTTIGQRIKNFRKAAGLSQFELAGKIGVTSQTVSKWECDVGLPDIIQIVPLSEVLGVSTDAILGADANMDQNIESLLNPVREKWTGAINDQSQDKTRFHYWFDLFKVYRELLRRYPTNHKTALQGASCGLRILRGRGYVLPEIEGLSVRSVLNDTERMCRAAINYCEDVSGVMMAKMILAESLFFAGERDRAYDEVAGLPDYYAKSVKYDFASFTDDCDYRLDCIKDYFSTACDDFLEAFHAVAESYSVYGVPKKEATYKVLGDLIAFCGSFTDLCDVRKFLYYKSHCYQMTAQNRIREGDYDGALDAIEKLTDSIEEYKRALGKDAADSVYYDGEEKDAWYISEAAKKSVDYMIVWAVSDFTDRENNPVVTSERYKACVERVKNAL